MLSKTSLADEHCYHDFSKHKLNLTEVKSEYILFKKTAVLLHDLNNWRARGRLKMRGKGKTWKWDWAFPLNGTINLSGIRSVIEFNDFIFQLKILPPYRHISASAKKSISLWFSGVTK